MKFLANENFPFPSINALRQKGYDVLSISESNFGISDLEVLNIAIKENRIILTFDKDYGEIIFKYKVEKKPSVIYFRSKGLSPTEASFRLLEVLNQNVIV